ncbi:MAG: metallophosphoesterase family protein [Nitratireductor sp.]|nr:metallophosphoesterase family protein [Nitratireductor sp.]
MTQQDSNAKHHTQQRDAAAGNTAPTQRKPKKFWILSDLHQEFPEFAWKPKIIPEHDALILAGDIHVPSASAIDYAETLTDKPVFMVAGNHEYYNQDWNLMIGEARERAARSPNVTFLEDDHVMLDDVHILGCTLWTDFQLFPSYPKENVVFLCERGMNDYRAIKRRGETSGRRRRIRPEHTLARHQASRKFLETEMEFLRMARKIGQEKEQDPSATSPSSPTEKIIVITHHAPLFECVNPEFAHDILSAAYASNLNDLIEREQPDLWVFGHTHISLDIRHGKTRIVSNAKGYGSQNPLFSPSRVVEI